MRYPLVAAFLVLCPAAFADTSVSVGFNAPGISIGFTRSSYPDLMLVPGMPVYYDPGFAGNYFFYDGQYWVYQGDEWYASGWYDGPWGLVDNYDVPLFLLRVPVQYYRRPPGYFRGWSGDAAPRWGEHWGHDWEQRRPGWDRWDRAAAPRAAPLPTYQRQYSGSRYPRADEQQRAIRSENYRYQPREPVTQQHFQQRANMGGERAEQQRPQGRQPQDRSQDQQQQQRQSRDRLPQDRPPQQRAQPDQPAQQHVQPVPAQPRGQRAQPEAQERGRDNRPDPQERGRDNRAEPQARGHENRPEPQGRGRDNRSEPQDRERDNRSDERGQDRR